ncbi:hypothetical protein MTR67_039203 [Solanum verrucosum]|uniref:Reverse transcriptase domain-containing protein n=1 Tax=Solanum verrucosum TaxID=315347 RepID=A0AAF0UGJ0_SOLVR|nr:hypothetical protein MTR67_039203 [Solanum verrucosum]
MDEFVKQMLPALTNHFLPVVMGREEGSTPIDNPSTVTPLVPPSATTNEDEVDPQLVSRDNHDILVYSESRSDHKQHLRIVLQSLRDQWLYTKFSKCEFWLESVAFLGHGVFKYYIMVDQEKIDGIRCWAMPTLVIEVRSFVGLAGYYKRFCGGLLHYRNTFDPIDLP